MRLSSAAHISHAAHARVRVRVRAHIHAYVCAHSRTDEHTHNCRTGNCLNGGWGPDQRRRYSKISSRPLAPALDVTIQGSILSCRKRPRTPITSKGHAKCSSIPRL